MSKYTIELRNVCNFYGREVVESWFSSYNLEDYLTQNQIEVLNNSGMWTKEKLAHKIVNHFYTREIGSETPEMFRLRAITTMEEVMEEYLPLLYSRAIEYDPLVNVDYTETFERETEGVGTSSSQSQASGLNVNSDTPQGQINKNEILQGKFASTTGASETSGSVSDTSNSNTNENYTKRVKGNSGVSATAQKMIEQFRNNIVAIDRDIMNKLNDLFMGIF